MGDPRKHRKKYVTPSHPWERGRIDEEKTITKQFGLRNKSEIWKMQAILRNCKTQAKDLIKRTDAEAEKQQELLMNRLINLGLIDKAIEVEKILDIPDEDVFNRRLQSIVYKQGLAHSVKQARQFIVHGHIVLDGKVVDVPSYMVKAGEETKISFKETSPLQDPDHAERVKEKKEVEEITVVEKKEYAPEEVKEAPKEEVKAEATPEVKEAPKEVVEEKKE